MKNAVGFPIRLKIMSALLVALTLVVITISFVMAGFFHRDKQSYMNDWVAMAALTSAEEARQVLEGHAERLRRYADIVAQEIDWEPKQELLRGLFDDFPELIHVALYEGDEALDPALDREVVQAAGIDVVAYEAHLAARQVPMADVRAGLTFVHNSSIDERLPSLTLAVAVGAPGDDRVVVAEIGAAALRRVGANFKVFEILLVSPDGRLLAHPDTGRVGRGETAVLADEARSVGEALRAGVTAEFRRDDTEMIGGYADVGYGGIIAAAHLPRAAAYLAQRDLLKQLTIVAAILLLVVALGSRLWARRITRPVERLAEATRSIARGEFEVQVQVTSRDEIGGLARSFNQMASELKVRDNELEQAHVQLIHSEKMAAFGQFGAGIAHEVKNPLAGILGCAQLSLLDAEEGSMLHENLQIIEKETSRCKKIIENLMRFARHEATELVPTDVNLVARDAVAIVQHQLEMNRVKIAIDLSSDVPLVSGNANQLQQVLMNLMINAQQAMGEESGVVTVSTQVGADGKVQIAVADTGPGIPLEIQSRLFEPFFTTKPTGLGTGLGLSVSYGIVRDHEGRIDVESEPGEGAIFIITLPALDESILEPIVEALDRKLALRT